MALRSSFKCKNGKDNCCFICGLVLFKDQKSDIDGKNRTQYREYFEIDPPEPKPWIDNTKIDKIDDELAFTLKDIDVDTAAKIKILKIEKKLASGILWMERL